MTGPAKTVIRDARVRRMNARVQASKKARRVKKALLAGKTTRGLYKAPGS